jgi:DNA-binding transcriptional LysR family regulator
MNVTLRQLEVFRSVVVTGSITKASRRVGLSQPSISQHLANLEDLLGAQLIIRNRTSKVVLTAEGEYWFKIASDMLRQFSNARANHETLFAEGRATLRIGSTPTLRGRFAGAAARIALQEKRFARFEFHWAVRSEELVELLRLHRLNCAIIGDHALTEDRALFSVTPLFVDSIAWVVPRSVPVERIHEALACREYRGEPEDPLMRYVDVLSAPMQPATDDWYRHNLPFATPFFGGTVYSAAIDFVAEGLATCHCPLSLLPNLSAATIRKLRWFRLDSMQREIVIAMPKHLLSLPAYANFLARLKDFARQDYSDEMMSDVVTPLPCSRLAPAD